VFYPGTYAESQAVGITVGAGMEAGGIDITLPASDETGPGTVFFRVSGDFPPPERVAGAMGLRGVRGERLPMIPQSAGDGRFSISPPDVGDYDMFMQVIEGSPADRENSLRHSVRVPVTVGREDIDLGTLPLVPAIRIEGVLLFDGTPPPNLDGFTFGLAPAPDETTIPFGSTALPAADGQSFTIDNVPDGRYEVRVNALPTDYFLSRATYGTQSVLGREVVVTGDTQARLELTFATGAAKVSGVVRGPDDSPTTGSTVALIPAPGGPGYRELYRATFTDQLGAFSIEGLTPGEYDVYAWEDAPLNAFRNAEFVAGFRNRGERIRVERNSSAILDLEVIPRE
jgi:hypothetical protein